MAIFLLNQLNYTRIDTQDTCHLSQILQAKLKAAKGNY